MSELRRLLDGDGTAEERLLLDSCLHEVPMPEGRSRTAKTLAAAGLATSAATVTSAAAKGAAVGASVVSAGAIKSVVVVLAALVITGGGALALSSRNETPTRPTYRNAVHPVVMGVARAGSSKTPERSVEPSSEASSSAADEHEIEPKQTAIARSPRRAAKPSPSVGSSATTPSIELPAPPIASASARPRSTLADETSALSVARAALARGDTASALHALDAYATSFPTGILSYEATVLRIETLLSAGDRANAVRLARSFVSASPKSGYATRLRKLLPEIDAP